MLNTVRFASSSTAGIRAATAVSRRFFHASPISRKTVTEKASEVAQKANKKLGKGLASALDKGEKATYAAKDSIDSVAGTAEKKAKEAGTAAKQKGNQAAAGAKEEMEKKL
ncbi:hypothetical protein NLJ89_g8946 [Agrocybe chaxingu]|uniref:Uncharacterized protein n=1 Tax=Agrocybe chaxingu TaxID=84603 RepID=A0A9W8K1I4_9AGAR|nr:hypothetical protein NLJ89_g8946 [Agrocybe chaxingu]